jgi:hypothetical protein
VAGFGSMNTVNIVITEKNGEISYYEYVKLVNRPNNPNAVAKVKAERNSETSF